MPSTTHQMASAAPVAPHLPAVAGIGRRVLLAVFVVWLSYRVVFSSLLVKTSTFDSSRALPAAVEACLALQLHHAICSALSAHIVQSF